MEQGKFRKKFLVMKQGTLIKAIQIVEEELGACKICKFLCGIFGDSDKGFKILTCGHLSKQKKLILRKYKNIFRDRNIT